MTNKSDEYIAKRIKALREKHGLTQKELAEKSGRSMNYISRIERADVTVSVDTLERIAKSLKVKSSDLLNF